jgi:enoyl-CoA hydratase
MKSFTIEVMDKIAVLEFSKVPSNSMDSLFFEEFNDSVKNLLADKNCEGIIIKGKGRHFSSGADISELLSIVESETSEQDFFYKNSESFLRLHQSQKPVLAIIQGVCLGSAFELALAAHFRIATHSALLGFPESQFNLITGCGGTGFASQFLNKKQLLDLLLTGRNLNADEAFELNLIDCIASKQGILEKSIIFVKSIADKYQPLMRGFYLQKLTKIFE